MRSPLPEPLLDLAIVQSALADAYDAVTRGARSRLLAAMAAGQAPYAGDAPEAITDQLHRDCRALAALEDHVAADVGRDYAAEAQLLLTNILLASAMGVLKLRGLATAGRLTDESTEILVGQFDAVVAECRTLMLRKNHDYGDSWKHMRIPSITDQMLVKVLRLIQLEELDAQGRASQVAEGRESEYKDIFNYAVFELLKLTWDGARPDAVERRFSRAS
ncbi:MAG TPA: DUF1599 domain-containing protein [bacterium]|nr:DUF1599 domain-containing protein [bacterium]